VAVLLIAWGDDYVYRVYCGRQVVLLGLPGIGLTTQAHKINHKFGNLYLSTATLAQQEVVKDSQEGKNLSGYMEADEPIPLYLVQYLFKSALSRSMENRQVRGLGLVLDGFPQTVADAQFLTQNDFIPDIVFVFESDPTISTARLHHKLVDPYDQKSYHPQANPPPDPATANRCYKRSSDGVQAVAERMKLYRSNIGDIIKYYRGFSKCRIITINGEVGIDNSFAQIAAYMKQPTNVSLVPTFLAKLLNKNGQPPSKIQI